jgi:hypothetical protein
MNFLDSEPQKRFFNFPFVILCSEVLIRRFLQILKELLLGGSWIFQPMHILFEFSNLCLEGADRRFLQILKVLLSRGSWIVQAMNILLEFSNLFFEIADRSFHRFSKSFYMEVLEFSRLWISCLNFPFSACRFPARDYTDSHPSWL